MAVYVGPAGLALTGNLRNFLTSVEGIGTLGLQNGLIKKIASHQNEPEQLQKIISSAWTVLISVTVLMSVVLFLFAGYFGHLVFGSSTAYRTVFWILALALPFYISGMFLTYLINGLGQYRRVIVLNIIGNLLALGFTLVLVMTHHITGALLSLVLPPAIMFAVAYYHLGQYMDVRRCLRPHFFSFSALDGLSAYALMTLVSAVAGSWVYLMIRQQLIHSSGVAQAGFWEAMSRISGYYMLFLSTVLSVYFYPKLSGATSVVATQNILKSYYRGILPVFFAGLLAVYFLRDVLVAWCFSADFSSVSELFFWQLLGDFFKASSLILGYQFLAKQLTRAYILTEIFSLILLAVLSYYWIPLYGAKGVVMAYAADYVLYFLLLAGYFRKLLYSA